MLAKFPLPILLVCVLSLLPAMAFADATIDGHSTESKQHTVTLAEVQQTLASKNVVRGAFTQTRTMEMFSQPLVSNGQFLLSKAHGLLWDQTDPFPVRLILTQDKLSQRFASQPPQVITAKENPMAFYFSHVFLSVFHGDTQQLEQQFDLSFQSSPHHWTLTLVPNSAPLNSVFQNITLTGNTDIEGVTLLEVRGDSTTIEFSQQTHQPDSLTNDEQAQFQF